MRGRRCFLPFFLCLIICLFGQCKRKQEKPHAHEFLGRGDFLGAYWPTTGWRSCRPEEVGMDSQGLIAAYDYAANPAINTEGLIIIRRGYIVGEAYMNGFGPDDRHESYSVAKSFLGAVVGIAINRGVIGSADDPVSQYMTQWQAPGVPAVKRRITIKHLLTMSSGLQWDEGEYYGDNRTDDIFLIIQTGDYVQYMLDKASEYEPGTRWRYSSGDSILLSGVLQEAAGMSTFEYAREHLFNPIGIPDVNWYSDNAGHTVGGWGIEATLREYAKFGYLYLREGQWDGQQVVPAEWVRESLSPVSQNIDFYGYQWWLAPVFDNYRDYGIPDGMFLAWGIYTQQIFVIPELELVIVRLGEDLDFNGNDAWVEENFLQIVVSAVND